MIDIVYHGVHGKFMTDDEFNRFKTSSRQARWVNWAVINWIAKKFLKKNLSFIYGTSYIIFLNIEINIVNHGIIWQI